MEKARYCAASEVAVGDELLLTGGSCCVEVEARDGRPCDAFQRIHGEAENEPGLVAMAVCC